MKTPEDWTILLKARGPGGIQSGGRPGLVYELLLPLPPAALLPRTLRSTVEPES